MCRDNFHRISVESLKTCWFSDRSETIRSIFRPLISLLWTFMLNAAQGRLSLKLCVPRHLRNESDHNSISMARDGVLRIMNELITNPLFPCWSVMFSLMKAGSCSFRRPSRRERSDILKPCSLFILVYLCLVLITSIATAPDCKHTSTRLLINWAAHHSSVWYLMKAASHDDSAARNWIKLSDAARGQELRNDIVLSFSSFLHSYLFLEPALIWLTSIAPDCV